jgi:hypothetical protein
LELVAGHVIWWECCPLINRPQPKEKARWFVCLGETGNGALIVLVTTTTQLHHYEANGARKNHTHVRFDTAHTPFEAPCILDLDDRPQTPSVETVRKYERDITIKGTLDPSGMQKIYQKLRISPHYSEITLQDIRNSFKKAGLPI